MLHDLKPTFTVHVLINILVYCADSDELFFFLLLFLLNMLIKIVHNLIRCVFFFFFLNLINSAYPD